MLSAPAILLTICAVTAQASPEVAPELPALPPGLSAPSELSDGTICLKPDLADAIDTEREQCHQLPARCQARLDILKERCALNKTPWTTYLEVGLVGAAVGALLTVLAFGLGGTG